MRNVIKIVKMDMAICRKSMIIMILSMLIAGFFCLLFLTPLLLGFFVVGSTAVVSAIFSVESKSNMEFFYGCFPIQKWEYIVGRSTTCLLVIGIPSVISIVMLQVGRHFSLCQIEEIRLITEMTGKYQMLFICLMIMIGLIGGANLLLAAFSGKIESREMFEVILLLLEALLLGAIVFLIQKIMYHGDMQRFLTDLQKWSSAHEILSCILFLSAGLIFLVAGAILSLKIVQRRRL